MMRILGRSLALAALPVSLAFGASHAHATTPVAAYEVESSEAARAHLEDLAVQVTDELLKYEIGTNGYRVRDRDAVVSIRDPDDRELSYRLLTRVSALDREEIAAADERTREDLQRRGDLERYERRRTQRQAAIEEGRPRDPFTISLENEFLVVTPLDGDLEFERNSLREGAADHVRALLESAGV